MNHHVQTARNYITDHKKQFIIGTGVVVGGAAAAILIAIFVYNSKPHYAYQPIKACDILTPVEAVDLLGDKVNSVDKNEPTVSGDVATSKCSYTDLNPDANNMTFVAVAVRSAVNDNGVEQNKTDFATTKSNNDVEIVKNLGESAYFNKTNGQLNILDGHKWIILSYGISSAPTTTTTDKLVEVAQKVLQQPARLPSF
jgi:hypothetical protein